VCQQSLLPTNHIASLIEDKSTTAADKAKLKGYYKKWTTLCSIFSKCMQDDEVNLLEVLTCLLRTIKETDKLSSRSLEQWPVYSSTL